MKVMIRMKITGIMITDVILLLKSIIISLITCINIDDLIQIIEMFHHNHHIPLNFLSLMIISLNIAHNNNFRWVLLPI